MPPDSSGVVQWSCLLVLVCNVAVGLVLLSLRDEAFPRFLFLFSAAVKLCCTLLDGA